MSHCVRSHSVSLLFSLVSLDSICQWPHHTHKCLFVEEKLADLQGYFLQTLLWIFFIFILAPALTWSVNPWWLLLGGKLWDRLRESLRPLCDVTIMVVAVWLWGGHQTWWARLHSDSVWHSSCCVEGLCLMGWIFQHRLMWSCALIKVHLWQNVSRLWSTQLLLLLHIYILLLRKLMRTHWTIIRCLRARSWVWVPIVPALVWQPNIAWGVDVVKVTCKLAYLLCDLWIWLLIGQLLITVHILCIDRKQVFSAKLYRLYITSDFWLNQLITPREPSR